MVTGEMYHHYFTISFHREDGFYEMRWKYPIPDMSLQEECTILFPRFQTFHMFHHACDVPLFHNVSVSSYSHDRIMPFEFLFADPLCITDWAPSSLPSLTSLISVDVKFVYQESMYIR